jgi:hypothetical protein
LYQGAATTSDLRKVRKLNIENGITWAMPSR